MTKEWTTFFAANGIIDRDKKKLTILALTPGKLDLLLLISIFLDLGETGQLFFIHLP